VLRIWFASEDMGRLRVARQPHALWETVLSLQTLQARQRTLLPGWREHALARLASARSSEALRVLRPLVPTRGYFPDFLTPVNGALNDGIAAVLSTPARRVMAELELMAQSGTVPEPAAYGLGPLGEALAYYHDTVLAPYMPRMRALVDADRAVRARALLDGGAEALLETLRPVVRWRPPLLEADYPVDQELRLDGRGLLLVPSVFCQRTPITLMDPSLPPTLVYSVGYDPGPDRPERPEAGDPLAALMGSTRGEVLRRLGEADCSTSELARGLGISIASASQHASVLRRSGLAVSRRAGNAVVHHITPLGAAVLRGGEHGDGPRTLSG
jgi:DNA-binding transcriptional ArsR family regulator